MAKLSHSWSNSHSSRSPNSSQWLSGSRLPVIFIILVLVGGTWSQTTGSVLNRTTENPTTITSTTPSELEQNSDVVPTKFLPNDGVRQEVADDSGASTTTQAQTDSDLRTSVREEETTTATYEGNSTKASSNSSSNETSFAEKAENELRKIHTSFMRFWERKIPDTEIRIGYLISGAIGAIAMLILVSFWCCCCRRGGCCSCRRRHRCSHCKNGHGGSEASDFLYMDNDPRSKYSF